MEPMQAIPYLPIKIQNLIITYAIKLQDKKKENLIPKMFIMQQTMNKSSNSSMMMMMMMLVMKQKRMMNHTMTTLPTFISVLTMMETWQINLFPNSLSAAQSTRSNLHLLLKSWWWHLSDPLLHVGWIFILLLCAFIKGCTIFFMLCKSLSGRNLSFSKVVLLCFPAVPFVWCLVDGLWL